MPNLQYSNPTPKKPVLKVALAILALTLISGAAYGSWKILGGLAPVTGEPATEPIARPEPDVTTDWKVYRNEKYRYEIKYPEGKVVAGGQPWESISVVEAKDVVISIGTVVGAFWIRVHGNPSRLSGKKYLEEILQENEKAASRDKYYPRLIVYEQGEQTINGVPAYYIDVWATDRIERRIYFSRTDKIYEISFPTVKNSDDPEAEQYFILYQYMLSTFSFIE